MENAIEVKNISKKFTHYPSQRDRFIDMATGGRAKRGTDFWALKDISFDVPKGTTFGIIGQNGSGKSTLLSILAGVLQPTSGTFTVNGRIAALLELGSGFHQEFTGRENVYMYGSILGLSRQEINRRFDEIIDFSELHEFIDRPLYAYSSGMVVRLAFATVVNVDADILIIDEALAVGDIFFQTKCIERMKRIVYNGATLLFVSHDPVSVKSLCEKAILLHSGSQFISDASDRVVEKYLELMVRGRKNMMEERVILDSNGFFRKQASIERIQNGMAYFKGIKLLDEHGAEISLIQYEQNIILRMTIEIFQDVPCLLFAYLIRDKNGIDAVYSDSHIEKNNLFSVKKGEIYSIDWMFRASLKQGAYYITCAISIPHSIEMGNVEFCDYIPFAVNFEIYKKDEINLFGLTHWDNILRVERKTAESGVYRP